VYNIRTVLQKGGKGDEDIRPKVNGQKQYWKKSEEKGYMIKGGGILQKARGCGREKNYGQREGLGKGMLRQFRGKGRLLEKG